MTKLLLLGTLAAAIGLWPHQAAASDQGHHKHRKAAVHRVVQARHHAVVKHHHPASRHHK